MQEIKVYDYQEELLTRHMPLGNFDADGEGLVIDQFIRSGDIVFDVGANAGSWSARVLQDHAPLKLHAFEPVPSASKKCKLLLGDRGTSHQIAIAQKHGTMTLHEYQSHGSELSSLYNRQRIERMFGLIGEEIQVAVTTLDLFCKEISHNHIHFLKIDTEGAEFDVLLGARDLLREQAIFYLQFEYGATYCDSHKTLRSVVDLLTSFGYIVFKIHPDGLVHVARWTDSLENYYQSNFLAASPSHMAGYSQVGFETKYVP